MIVIDFSTNELGNDAKEKKLYYFLRTFLIYLLLNDVIFGKNWKLCSKISVPSPQRFEIGFSAPLEQSDRFDELAGPYSVKNQRSRVKFLSNFHVRLFRYRRIIFHCVPYRYDSIFFIVLWVHPRLIRTPELCIRYSGPVFGRNAFHSVYRNEERERVVIYEERKREFPFFLLWHEKKPNARYFHDNIVKKLLSISITPVGYQ